MNFLSLFLSIVLIVIFVSGIVSDVVPAKLQPNEGIRHSMRNVVWLGSRVGATFMLTFVLMQLLFNIATEKTGTYFYYYELLGAAFTGLFLSFILMVGIALLHIGRDILKHYTLRLVLASSKAASLNYVRFLDHAAERILLRKVGGGYIFVHRMLLEYFANLEEEQR
jgi:hypothetical protein